MSSLSTCRICGGQSFETVVDLGWQALTGIFPKTYDPNIFPGGVLRLIRCTAVGGCGLVQLDNSFAPALMYGDGYGYRSGLNSSMVRHLEHRVQKIIELAHLKPGDIVVDIGSNDGTSLGFYSSDLVRIGIDPTADKFRQYYPHEAIIIPTFFSSDLILNASNGKRANVISAFSMMYDLENPIQFAKEVASVLATDGIWVFEQSYLPLMLEQVAFDTICHEHIEYYGLRQIDWLLACAGLEAIDVELNKINGGSFAITAAHVGAFGVSRAVTNQRDQEQLIWDNASSIFAEFAQAVETVTLALSNFLNEQLAAGKTIAALGASTKGNVLLQHAKLNSSHISVIGDVNPEKFRCVTPGSSIPIVPEEEALMGNFDYYLVLPWHFKDFFLNSEIFKGKKLIFPLPALEIIQR